MASKSLTLDRTITLSLVFAIAVQTAGGLLWAGAAEARIISLEAQAKTSAPVHERLARIEEQMTMTHRSLTRIERRLDNREGK